jgi:hypothetical protein|tara:strand:+ start:119 stop:325 length:207 start_codon:yes stop_codon:yes gene_type:complete
MDVSGRGAYIFDKPETRDCILCGKNSEGLFCNSCNLRFTLLNTEKALELFNLIVYKLEELVDDEKGNE